MSEPLQKWSKIKVDIQALRRECLESIDPVGLAFKQQCIKIASSPRFHQLFNPNVAKGGNIMIGFHKVRRHRRAQIFTSDWTSVFSYPSFQRSFSFTHICLATRAGQQVDDSVGRASNFALNGNIPTGVWVFEEMTFVGKITLGTCATSIITVSYRCQLALGNSWTGRKVRSD